MPANSIVFVHGLFMSKHSWEPWVERYQAQGRQAIAVAWPGRDRPVADLRAKPDPELPRRTLSQVIEHYVTTIKALDEKPVLIGHSLGGLIAQLLLGRGVAKAAVAIDSGPPFGVLSSKWSFYKSAWPLLNPFASLSKPYLMPFEGFQYSFVNGQPLAQQRAAYDNDVVPESIRLARGALTPAAAIDYKSPRPPLLLIAGEKDHIIPPSINRTNFKRYKPSAGVTEFKEFAGRNHFGVGAPGWEEIADYSLAWLDKHA